MHVSRHRAHHVPNLRPDPLRHGLDAVAVQLLDPPEQAVAGRQHALEGIAAPVFPTQLRLMLFDTAARVIDHRQLPFQAYRLEESQSV